MSDNSRKPAGADAAKPVSSYLLRPVRSQSEAVQHLRARTSGSASSAAANDNGSSSPD